MSPKSTFLLASSLLLSITACAGAAPDGSTSGAGGATSSASNAVASSSSSSVASSSSTSATVGSTSSTSMSASSAVATSSSSSSSGGAGGAGSTSSSGSSSSSGGGAPPAPGRKLFAKSFGDPADGQVARRVAIDPQGNVVIAGSLGGAMDFGGGALTCPSPGYGGFVAKLTPGGAHLWSKVFCGTVDVQGLAVDPASGDVALSGGFEGATDFGAGMQSSVAQSQDVFVVKLAKNGDYLWSKTWGDDANQQEAYAVAFDPFGDLVIGGALMGTLDLGGGATMTSAGGLDGFALKLDPSGSVLWYHRYGDNAYYQYVGNVGVDAAGGIVLGGLFQGAMNFGGGDLVCPNGSTNDLFVVKLDPAGQFVWSKQLDQGGQSSVYFLAGLAVNAAGEIALSGAFNNPLSFGGPPIVTNGHNDLFVAKLDAAGQQVFARAVGDMASNYGWSAVGIDANGDVLWTGEMDGAFDFGGGTLQSAGLYDVFVAKYDGKGNHVFSTRAGDATYQGGDSVAVDAAGNAWVVGYFNGALDFGGGALQSAGASDAFLVELAP